MECLTIQPTSLVLLSGPPGSGKTTACQALPPTLVISSDRLRESFFGTAKTVIDGKLADHPMDIDDRLIFATMENVVRARLRAGLTTVVDATLISDKERKPFAAIAEELGVPIQVIIFEVPEAQLRQQNQARRCPVPNAVLTHFIKRLARQSQWPYTVVTCGCQLTVDVLTIPAEQALDVIGDVHGLADGLQALLTKLGYDAAFQHPEGRKLCFLGDLVDRGPQSLAVLDLVRAIVAQGHYCVKGNHDNNLALGLRGQPLRSQVTRETLHHVLVQGGDYPQKIQHFIEGLPTYYRYGDYILCHGDIEWFDPIEQPTREHIYGRCRIHETHDTDGIFRQTTDLTLIRGHIPLTSEGQGVFALEAGAGFGGPIVAMRLPGETPVTLPCAFDYRQRSPTFAKRMEPLVSAGLVKKVTHDALALYKYTAKAFFSPEAWQQHPELKLARGVVVGMHGDPVSQPFPRTFNYQEQGTMLPLDTPVVAIEKLNGFLVTTFLHPYDRNQLVTTCSGSFEGEYVAMAKALLFQKKLYGRVLAWLRQQPTVTLLWEAIHPDDPHIIPYTATMHGLHLIGAGQLGAGFDSEAQLDTLAAELQVPRPAWFTATFGEVVGQLAAVEHEGFMIRCQADGRFALKLKSPYYLKTKFLARLNEKRSRFMFNRPDRFKQDLDESLWPLVDWVTGEMTLAAWLAWSDAERRDFIQVHLAAFYQS